MLYTSWLFQKTVPQVISFNFGSLGFLTEFDSDNIHEALDNYLNDEYKTNNRMRLTCTTFRFQKRHRKFLESEQFEVHSIISH